MISGVKRTNMKLGIIITCLLLMSTSVLAQLPGEKVSFKAADGLTIKGTLGQPAEVTTALPAVILIHQGGSDRNEWSGFFEQLIKEGYIVLAYDIRSHGKSDNGGPIGQLFNDPHKAPLDLQAAVTFLQETEGVDKNRIGIVGASVGSNLACVAAGSKKYAIKTAVAISGKASAVYDLGGDENLTFRSIYHIASEKEQGGMRAKWAQEMYDKTAEPRKIEVVKGSSSHGSFIFKDDNSLKQRIMTWLQNTL